MRNRWPTRRSRGKWAPEDVRRDRRAGARHPRPRQRHHLGEDPPRLTCSPAPAASGKTNLRTDPRPGASTARRDPPPRRGLTCPSCAEVASGMDVQEIDGASNTGIDDIRSLRENAAYAPSRLRYKVYIIDEVHMLSKQAFNGLAEDARGSRHPTWCSSSPPPNPTRSPTRSLSRVQRFDFRHADRRRSAGAAVGDGPRGRDLRRGGRPSALMARYAFGSMRDGAIPLRAGGGFRRRGASTAALVEGMLGLVGGRGRRSTSVSAAVLDGAGPALTRFAALLSRGRGSQVPVPFPDRRFLRDTGGSSPSPARKSASLPPLPRVPRQDCGS